MIRRALLVLVSGVIAVSCGRQPSRPREAMLIKFPAGVDERTQQRLLDRLDAERIRVLPRSHAQVWMVNRTDLEQQIRAELPDEQEKAVYVEQADGQRFDVLPEGSVPLGELTPDQKNRLDTIVAGSDANDVRVTEARPTLLNADVLIEPSLDKQEKVNFELLGGNDVVLTRDRIEQRGEGNFTWIGSPESQPGSAVLVLDNGELTGSIQVEQDTYQVRPIGGGRQVIMRIRPSALPPEHPTGTPRPRSARPPRPEARDFSGDTLTCPGESDKEISVLIAYSDDARRTVRDVVPLGRTALAQTNLSFVDSGVDATVTEAGIIASAFRETGDVEQDLDQLVRPNDGRADDVLSERERLRADVAVLLTTNRQACGIAAQIGAVPPTGLATVSTVCAVANLSFAHELGHLFGARHDPAADPSSTPFSYGHGYVDGSWRTIMAYPTACNGCPRIGRWSNPAARYPKSGNNARPLGLIGVSEEARVLNERRAALSKFKCKGSAAAH